MQKPHSVSGVYPHLAMFNDEGECGTGAVVVWAGRLWVVTYAPHKPAGSSAFPSAFGAYWVRCIAEQAATATAQLLYS
ncbi:hypothetical protein [Armatimonas sp.]|uniref:hypothetical protein n=1 Tax=Armatimonas sp. TaxID=1872638 RepID=UPI00286A2D99|nr:hypothetical protein [Armatimonas sp.]